MKKRIFAIFLIMILAITNMTICYADGIDDLVNIGIGNYDQTVDNVLSIHNNAGDELKDLGDTWDETSSGIIKVIMNILSFIPKVVVNLLLEIITFILPSMDDVIFNDRASLWGNFFRLTYFDEAQGGLAGQMVGFVSTIYQAFRYVALIGFVVAIAAIAVKMIISSIGKQKQQYKEALKNWLVGLVLLVVGHWIMIYAIYFSEFLVNIIVAIKDSLLDGWLVVQQAGNATFDLTSSFSSAVGAAGAAAWGMTLLMLWGVLAIIAIIVFVAMNMKIVKVYLERVIVVGVLIMIFPLVTVFYAFEKGGIKKGNTFESWLRTFIDQVFIQPIHALSLMGVCIALTAISNAGITAIPIVGMILVLMVLNTMFTIENVVKRVFAINGASLGSPVNPVGAAMTGVGMAAPMLRKGFDARKNAISDAKANSKNFLQRQWAGSRAASAGVKEGIKSFSVSGKYGVKNAKALAGMAGISLPDEIFNVDKLSQKEQKDTVKRLKKAALTGTVSGTQVANDIRNMEHMMDPEIVSDIKRKCGVGATGVDQTLARRKYMQMLADPTIDVSGLTEPEFDYYTNSTDSNIKRDMEKGAKLTGSTRVAANVIQARKAYMVRHADEADEYMRELGLDEATIVNVENGSASDNDALAYELFLRKCEGLDIDARDCMDASGKNYDAGIVHNIDMSDAKMKKNFATARDVSQGSPVDASIVNARKVYAAKNRKKAEKIQRESGLSEATIQAIEVGDNTVSADDILSYKIMVDRLGTEQDLDTYMDSAGNISEVIYNGVSMDSATINSEAASLVHGMPDVINDSTANSRARSVLAGFRNKDEDKLFRCASSVGANVNINDINNFIDGKPVSAGCDAAAILAVIDQVMVTK